MMWTTLLESVGEPLVSLLGWAILHSLWQGVLIAGLLAIGLRLAGEARSQARWLMACVALTSILAAPVITAALMDRDTRQRSSDATQTSDATSADEIATSPAISDVAADVQVADPTTSPTDADDDRFAKRTTENATPSQSQTSWQAGARAFRVAIANHLPAVVLTWLLGVLAFSLWHLGGWLQLRRLRLNALPERSDSILAMFTRLRRDMNVSRPIPLLRSAGILTPMVVGWLRPAIMLPASAITGLSPDQLHAVLAHELAHIRRHDAIIRWVQAGAETLLFYHPAAWWISKVIRDESEHCCDQAALDQGVNRTNYARALAHFADAGRHDIPLAAAAADGPLLTRVRRILQSPAPNVASAPRWRTGLLTLAAVAITVAATAWLHADEAVPATPIEATSAEPSVANPVDEANTPSDAATTTKGQFVLFDIEGPKGNVYDITKGKTFNPADDLDRTDGGAFQRWLANENIGDLGYDSANLGGVFGLRGARLIYTNIEDWRRRTVTERQAFMRKEGRRSADIGNTSNWAPAVDDLHAQPDKSSVIAGITGEGRTFTLTVTRHTNSAPAATFLVAMDPPADAPLTQTPTPATPSTSNANAMKPAFAAIFKLITEDGDAAAGLAKLNELMPEVMQWRKTITDDHAAAAADFAISMLRQVRNALEAGDIEKATQLLYAIDTVGPVVDDQISLMPQVVTYEDVMSQWITAARTEDMQTLRRLSMPGSRVLSQADDVAQMVGPVHAASVMAVDDAAILVSQSVEMNSPGGRVRGYLIFTIRRDFIFGRRLEVIAFEDAKGVQDEAGRLAKLHMDRYLAQDPELLRAEIKALRRRLDLQRNFHRRLDTHPIVVQLLERLAEVEEAEAKLNEQRPLEALAAPLDAPPDDDSAKKDAAFVGRWLPVEVTGPDANAYRSLRLDLRPEGVFTMLVDMGGLTSNGPMSRAGVWHIRDGVIQLDPDGDEPTFICRITGGQIVIGGPNITFVLERESHVALRQQQRRLLAELEHHRYTLRRKDNHPATAKLLARLANTNAEMTRLGLRRSAATLPDAIEPAKSTPAAAPSPTTPADPDVVPPPADQPDPAALIPSIELRFHALYDAVEARDAAMAKEMTDSLIADADTYGAAKFQAELGPELAAMLPVIKSLLRAASNAANAGDFGRAGKILDALGERWPGMSEKLKNRENAAPTPSD